MTIRNELGPKQKKIHLVFCISLSIAKHLVINVVIEAEVTIVG